MAEFYIKFHFSLINLFKIILKFFREIEKLFLFTASLDRLLFENFSPQND